ncbi:MAG TPA: hypothetical protein VKA25_09800, partial [Gemmatimonadales bacterium]|nr:hypothetical protein [Gemmatimonadales bacterium]
MSRSRVSLDGSWQFFPDPEQQFTHQSLGQLEPRLIQVPGPWQAQFDDLRDYSGLAWYRKEFELPKATSTASAFLHF